jgi:hypothetical protein
MDEVAAISRILCCISLPDGEVYPALAGLRDIRRTGNPDEIAVAFKHLLYVFFGAVERGLGGRTGSPRLVSIAGAAGATPGKGHLENP